MSHPSLARRKHTTAYLLPFAKTTAFRERFWAVALKAPPVIHVRLLLLTLLRFVELPQFAFAVADCLQELSGQLDHLFL